MVRYRKLESLMTRGPHMVKVRFTEFTTSIVTAYKKVQQIKKIQTEEYAVFGIRAAHVMYLYYMGLHPDGLTVTELANLCCEDKAATSRGIDYLVEKGYCYHEEDEARKRWRSKVMLTKEGIAVSRTVHRIAAHMSAEVPAGIPAEDLDVFYRVFNQLIENLDRVK